MFEFFINKINYSKIYNNFLNKTRMRGFSLSVSPSLSLGAEQVTGWWCSSFPVIEATVASSPLAALHGC
jgi:hypothetical protein